MVLPAVIPQMWVYGFVGTTFTHNPYWTGLVVYAIWLSGAFPAVHCQDTETDIFQLHVVHLGAALLGCIAGFFTVYLFKFPAPIRFRSVFRYDRSATVWRPVLYVDDLIWLLVTLVSFGVVAGVYTWWFYDDPAKACAALTDPAQKETKQVVGAILFFVFLALGIGLVVWLGYRFFATDVHNANFKYGLSMVVWFLPAGLIFDRYFEDPDVRPAHLWFTVLAFLGVALLTWLWNRWFFMEIDPVWGKPATETTESSDVVQKQRGADWFTWVVAMGVILDYISTAVVDSSSTEKPTTLEMFWVNLVYTPVIILIFWAMSLAYRAKGCGAVDEIDEKAQYERVDENQTLLAKTTDTFGRANKMIKLMKSK